MGAFLIAGLLFLALGFGLEGTLDHKSVPENGGVTTASKGIESPERERPGCLSKRFFWSPEQTAVSIPGITLSAYFSSILPLRNIFGSGFRVEGGPEFRLYRAFLSLGFSQGTRAEISGFPVSKLAYDDNSLITDNTLTLGVAIIEYSGYLAIASLGLEGDLVSSGGVAGVRYAIEFRHASLGLEASVWDVGAPFKGPDNDPWIHTGRRQDYCLSLKYRFEILQTRDWVPPPERSTPQ